MRRWISRSCPVVCLTLAVMMLGVGGCNAPQRYDAAQLGTSEQAGQAARQYWKREGWSKLDQAKVKKVAIAEFTVEYVIDRDKQLGGNQLGGLMAMRMVGVGRKAFEFDDDMKRQLPDDMYAQFVQSLEAAGYEVIPMAAVANSAAMGEMVAGEAGSRKRGQFSQGWDGGSQRVEMYPVSGLPRLNDGFFTFGKNARQMGPLLGELGADAVLRVHTRVGLHDGQATAEMGSTVQFVSELQTSPTVSGGTQYWAKTAGSAVSHRTLFYEKQVVDSKEFEAFRGSVYKVNPNDYRQTILEFYPSYATMAVQVLQ